MSKSRIRDSLNADCEKRPSRKTTQQNKTAFRNTSTWQKYRKYRKRHDEVDYVTHRHLSTKWSLHHMDLDIKHYTDLSDYSHFIALNNNIHDVVHQLYPFYEEDPKVIDRLELVLRRMRAINHKEKVVIEDNDFSNQIDIFDAKEEEQ